MDNSHFQRFPAMLRLSYYSTSFQSLSITVDICLEPNPTSSSLCPGKSLSSCLNLILSSVKISPQVVHI